MPSPFPPTASKSGHGSVHLTILPPSTPTFTVLSYTYPLKLLPSTPHILPQPTENEPPSPQPSQVPLLFLLTYGGGLLSADQIHLTLTLDPSTRLTLTTQGSTKIYKPSPSTTPPPPAQQTLTARIAKGAALWLAPDPVQPFAGSSYTQTQIFNVERGGSVGMVDWVSEGRSSRGEKWDLEGYRGRNEIWDISDAGGEKRRRILVRDAAILEGGEGEVRRRMDGMGVFGTVLLRGPLFVSLSGFFVEEFAALPRIGGRNWADDDAVKPELEGRDRWRGERVEREREGGVLWTACVVRGVTVVKFAGREVEGARRWLGGMLREEGSVGKEIGEGGLMFVR